MSTVKAFLCSCGGTPEATVSRVAEDLLEAVVTCNQCGCQSDPIEHVWGGGVEARLMAFEEWNRMRKSEILRQPPSQS